MPLLGSRKAIQKYALPSKFHLTRWGLGAHAQQSHDFAWSLLAQASNFKTSSSGSAYKRFAWHLGSFPRKMRSIA